MSSKWDSNNEWETSVVWTRVHRIWEGGLSSAIYWRRRSGWIHSRTFLEKINRIQDMYHNNSNNLEATYTYVKLSEKKSNISLRNLSMFGNNPLFCHCGGQKNRKNLLVINGIWKLIIIKSLIFRFHRENLMLSINSAMLK